MSSPLLRRTTRGAGVGALLFFGVALIQVLRADVPPMSVLQPLLVLAVLGATIGALGGPLVAAAYSRVRASRHGRQTSDGG